MWNVWSVVSFSEYKTAGFFSDVICVLPVFLSVPRGNWFESLLDQWLKKARRKKTPKDFLDSYMIAEKSAPLFQFVSLRSFFSSSIAHLQHGFVLPHTLYTGHWYVAFKWDYIIFCGNNTAHFCQVVHLSFGAVFALWMYMNSNAANHDLVICTALARGILIRMTLLKSEECYSQFTRHIWWGRILSFLHTLP